MLEIGLEERREKGVEEDSELRVCVSVLAVDPGNDKSSRDLSLFRTGVETKKKDELSEVCLQKRPINWRSDVLLMRVVILAFS